MEPDRKQTDDDNIIKEYHEEIITKAWSKRLKTIVAITTLILAVVGTLASFKAASLGNQVVISQNEAFNHWSHYQEKTIKKSLFSQKRDSSFSRLLKPIILPSLR